MDNVERRRDFRVFSHKWDAFRFLSSKLRDLYRRGVERLSEPMANDSKKLMFSTYNRTDNMITYMNLLRIRQNVQNLSRFKPHKSHRTKEKWAHCSISN